MFNHEQWRKLSHHLPKRKIPEEITTFIECTTSPLCVACSGGSDSLVLLLLTKLFWPKRTVIVLHYNHRIRAVSDEEERQMIDLARKLDVKIEVGHRPIMPETHHLSDAVPGTNKTPSNPPLPFLPHPSLLRSDGSLSGLPSETELRTLRYAFFEKMLRLHRSDILLLGHHADDRLETVLMRLVRGVGFEGLVAPRALHRVSFYTKVRPLLNFSKNEIRNALIACNVPFFEDATNDEDDCLRNRIRHTLIPAFDEVFPSHWRNGFKRSCQLLSKQRDDLKQRLEQRFRHWDFSKKTFERIALRTLSIVELRCFLQTWFQQHGVQNFGSQTIDTVCSALHEKGTVIFPLDPEHRLYLDDEKISLITQTPKPPKPVSITWRNGMVFFPNGARLSFKEEPYSTERYKEVTAGTFSHNNTVILDAEAFSLPRTVRFWRNGDRYRPLGAKNKVKVKDLFSARKIPTDRRHQLPVICSANGDIAWIPGLPPSDAFKLTLQTKRCVFLFYQTHKILYGEENGGEKRP